MGSLLIKKGKNHVGIVTETDLVRKALAGSQDVSKLTVEKIMTSPVCTIESSRAVDEAQDMMGDLGVRHLGVTKGGSIVGVVSVRDLLMFYKRYAQSKLRTSRCILNRKSRKTSRTLKTASSVVLGRTSPCNVPQGYASSCPLPAALLEGRFEHPAPGGC